MATVCAVAFHGVLRENSYRPEVLVTKANRFGPDLLTVAVEVRYNGDRINIHTDPSEHESFGLKLYSGDGVELNQGHHRLETADAVSDEDSSDSEATRRIERTITIEPGGVYLAFVSGSPAERAKQEQERKARVLKTTNAIRGTTKVYAIVSYEVATSPFKQPAQNGHWIRHSESERHLPSCLGRFTIPAGPRAVRADPVSVRRL